MKAHCDHLCQGACYIEFKSDAWYDRESRHKEVRRPAGGQACAPSRSSDLNKTTSHADLLGDAKDSEELNLGTAGEWARDTLVSFKVYEERARRDQNVYALVTPEALGTLNKALWDAGK